MSEELTISSSDGLALEAGLDSPDEPGGVLVLCHPHPKMGGTMNAPLLLALRDDLVERGWAVLRFNFRGIGNSEGEPGMGVDEVADARGALEWSRRRFGGIPDAIAGWSFGAAVAVRIASEDEGTRACVAIAPSVREKPGVTAGLPDPSEVRSDLRLLVVCAGNDELVDPGACKDWSNNAGARHVEMRGANHFFWAKYDRLAAEVGDFLGSALTDTRR